MGLTLDARSSFFSFHRPLPGSVSSSIFEALRWSLGLFVQAGFYNIFFSREVCLRDEPMLESSTERLTDPTWCWGALENN